MEANRTGGDDHSGILVGETEVVLKISHVFSDAVFGAPLAVSNAEEGSVGNRVLRTTRAPGLIHLHEKNFNRR